MSWEMEQHSNPVARKNYTCNAADWLLNTDWEDFSKEDVVTILLARKDGFRILKGEKYVKVTGKWEGEFSVFRARPELEAICQKYDVYDDY